MVDINRTDSVLADPDIIRAAIKKTIQHELDSAGKELIKELIDEATRKLESKLAYIVASVALRLSKQISMRILTDRVVIEVKLDGLKTP